MKRAFLSILICSCISVFSFGQKKEELQIFWPKEYEWKVANKSEDSVSEQTLLIPKNETLGKWSIIALKTTMKHNFKAKSIDDVIKEFTQSSLHESTKAKATVLEKDTKAKNFWAIFKIETPDFPNDPIPESQLWYAIQGNATLYVNFVAVKKDKLSDEFIKSGLLFLKTVNSSIINSTESF